MIFGGDDIVIWVRVGEIVEDWIGIEIVDVIIELGKWVKGWFRGFFLGDVGVLVRNEFDCCFGGIVCGGWRVFVVIVCFFGWIIFVKFKRVRVGFDWRLFDDDGNFMVDFFCGRFNFVIVSVIWVFCLGFDLFIVVFFIFVILVVVIIGFCIVNIEVGDVILVIIRFDCVRFFKIDKVVVVVVVVKDGVRVGDVIEGGFLMFIIEEVIFGMFLILVLLEFYKI